MSRLVLFIFAGRQANLEVQMPYLHRILDTYPEAELHLWDLTRNRADQSYVRGLAGAQGGRVRVLTHLHEGFPLNCVQPPGAPRRRGWRRCECMIHKPPYEKPYIWYAEHAEYAEATFVKLDDDVLFLETDRFDDLIDPLVEHPNRIISANVINNAVCAKYEPIFAAGFTPSLGSPFNPANDKNWWALHISADFARASHREFLDRGNMFASDFAESEHVRTRPGEAISINCIAFTGTTMKRLARTFAFNPRLGDEGVVDSMLPWIARSFHAAHLTFGPQDAAMTAEELRSLRGEYAALAEEYLDDSSIGEMV